MLVLLFVVVLPGAFCDSPLVTTPLGLVQGYHQYSLNGRKFSAFEGIPYARPPVGTHRFEEPKPIVPWYGVWNATFTTKCVQNNMTMQNLTMGDEDCLHINVYVPREQPNPSSSYNVIVHIHGGAYTYGSGDLYAKPNALMDRDVIFVTFNYRLGIFGFLSTEDEVVPGNNGLKDQTMALRWIRENIASFGGNTESVTITGLSAGGSSVHLHYFSPLSKDLFHRGFAQSGFALNPWSIKEEPLANAKKLGEALGCPTNNTTILVECLKQRPVKQLQNKIRIFFTLRMMPCIPFGPVVEKKNPGAFIDEDPYISMKNGRLLDVPLLASVVTNEGLFPMRYLEDDLSTIQNHWESLAPGFFEFTGTLPEPKWSKASQKIKEFYFGTTFNTTQLVKVFSDRFFLTGAEKSMTMQANVTKSPVYFFVFGYPNDDAVGHGDERKYYFSEKKSNETKMTDLMLDLMVSFSKTGKPVFGGQVDWKPTSGERLTFLKITGVETGNEVKTVDELTPKSFWEGLGFQEGEKLISN